MRSLSHRRSIEREPLLRSPWFAYVWVLFFTVFSCVLVAHTHGALLSNKDAQVSAISGNSQFPSEEGCPLCVAVHSTLPAAETALLLSLSLFGAAPQVFVDWFPDFSCHAPLLSRPPPFAQIA